jgi:outer membrane protein OmpA-like peptidoglycan-associated protein
MNFKVFIFLFVLFHQDIYSQNRIKVDTSFKIDFLLDQILDKKSIVINNVKFRGLSHSIGTFKMDSNAIGIQKGLVMSTGNINDAVKGNKTPGTSGLAWDNNYRFKSDRDLNLLSQGRVCDQIVLEFDFIPLENQITFRYFFASEEYKEYVGSRFNDVFGFIVTGDGNFRKNLALVPERSDPVTVNNINHVKNSSLYINNNCFENLNIKKNIDEQQLEPRTPFFKNVILKLFGFKNKNFTINKEELKKMDNFLFNNFEYDGLTKPLTASCFLTPYKVYHMKIAIGDVGDPMFDSGVFIEEGSFQSKKNRNAPYFKEYEDLRGVINFDSLFKEKVKTPIKIDSPPQIDERFEITNVNFETNKVIIPDSSEINIRELAVYLIKNKTYRVHLFGYTDNIGSLEYNQELSVKRAKKVKELLVATGVAEERINYIGNNFANPLDNNDSEKGRSANRRVEIVVLE